MIKGTLSKTAQIVRSEEIDGLDAVTTLQQLLRQHGALATSIDRTCLVVSWMVHNFGMPADQYSVTFEGDALSLTPLFQCAARLVLVPNRTFYDAIDPPSQRRLRTRAILLVDPHTPQNAFQRLLSRHLSDHDFLKVIDIKLKEPQLPYDTIFVLADVVA